jgi:hypothetical protein
MNMFLYGNLQIFFKPGAKKMRMVDDFDRTLNGHVADFITALQTSDVDAAKKAAAEVRSIRDVWLKHAQSRGAITSAANRRKVDPQSNPADKFTRAKNAYDNIVRRASARDLKLPS